VGRLFGQDLVDAGPRAGSGGAGGALDSGGDCPSGRVLLISESDDSAWAFAIIEEGGKSNIVHVGEPMFGGKLARLAWDRVWIRIGARECELRLGKGASSNMVEAPPASDGNEVPPEIASKIARVSDNELRVTRDAIDAIMSRQAELMRGTRLEPHKQGDRVTGLRATGVRKGSLLYLLGIRDGDELVSIGGIALTSPQQAFEAYGRLRSADRVTLIALRGGRTLSIDYVAQK
jgi:general secretion pathway protein C